MTISISCKDAWYFPAFEVDVSLYPVSSKDTVDQPKYVGKIYYNATNDNFEAVVFVN